MCNREYCELVLFHLRLMLCICFIYFIQHWKYRTKIGSEGDKVSKGEEIKGRAVKWQRRVDL